MRALTQVALGALGGLAGAVVMSGIMAVGKQFGLIKKTVPYRLETQIEKRLGTAHKTSPEQKGFLSQVLHMVMGTGFGTGYGLLRQAVHLPGLILGPVYGLGVYVFNEFFAGPLLRLTPHPKREPARRVWRRLFMHLVYGLVLAFFAERGELRSGSQAIQS